MRGRARSIDEFGDPREALLEWIRTGPGMGFGRRPGRRVDRGDVKYLILSVLTEGPKHGYEIIREIEQRTEGAYVPSPGTVYPTLQMLEDVGHVRSAVRDERRTYELTEAGRSYLQANEPSTGQAWEQFQEKSWRGPFPWNDDRPEQRELHAEIHELMRAIFADGRAWRCEPKTAAEVTEALRAARQRVAAAYEVQRP